MNRPWKVWLSFLLTLAVVVPAMGWLTHKAIELDGEVAASARSADLEEDISLALWRMDVALAPLVAQEAARPYVVYRPFLIEPDPDGVKGGKGGLEPQVSPLLVQPSEFVQLHFQLDEDGQLTSPQCPSGTLQELAVHNGAPLGNITVSRQKLAQLSERVHYDALVDRLPEQTLPPFEVTELAWNNRLNTSNYNFDATANDSGQQVLVQNDSQLQELYPNLDPLNNPPGQQEAVNAPPAQSDDDQLAQANQPDAPNPQMAGPQQQAANPSNNQPRGRINRRGAAEQTSRWTEQFGDNLYGYGRAQRAQDQRGQVEFQRRNKALQSYANTEVVRQRKQLPITLPKQHVQEGVSAPLWVDGELLLARRVQVEDREIVQGCWFDWQKLKPFLIAEGIGTDNNVAAALPEFDLRPIADDREVPPARRLATLPVEIVVPSPALAPAPLSPIRISLWIAWGCLIFATCCVGLLLQGVVSLSERRGAFVSAVTHELRTPLTTFRMYAEMLSAGMVRDPQQRQQYTDTLRVEADRLAHLVENVLSYARLERGRKGGRREEITLGKLLERSASRLEDRARSAEMALSIDAPDDLRAAVLYTDPQAVEQIVFNLVDNACKYAQTAEDRTIAIRAARGAGTIALHVCDRGPGISAAFAKRLFQPFSKSAEDAAVSAPGVGLGLALCRRLAREIGGALELERSEIGAAFRLELPLAR